MLDLPASRRPRLPDAPPATLFAFVIDPRSVEVFYWVVQLGGFRRAAEKLGTTQPAISARVAGLEAIIGSRLLDRGQRRRMSLTPEGMRLLSYAERQLALQAEMEAAFRGTQGLEGTVRLGVAETIVHTLLSALLRRLHEAHPGLQVDIVVEVSSVLRAMLLAGEVDLVLLLGPVEAPGVHDVPLCEHRLEWVAAPGLSLGPEPLDVAALARVPIITYARASRPFHQVRDVFAGVATPRIFANASLASIVRMVLDGIGVGVIAPAAIQAELDSGQLRVVRTTVALAPMRFSASWRTAPGEAAAAVARLAQMIAQGDQT